MAVPIAGKGPDQQCRLANRSITGWREEIRSERYMARNGCYWSNQNCGRLAVSLAAPNGRMTNLLREHQMALLALVKQRIKELMRPGARKFRALRPTMPALVPK